MYVSFLFSIHRAFLFVSSLSVLQVLVPKDENLMGKLVTVEITETGKHFMKCRLVRDGEVKRPATVPPPLPKGKVSGFKQVTFTNLNI